MTHLPFPSLALAPPGSSQHPHPNTPPKKRPNQNTTPPKHTTTKRARFRGSAKISSLPSPPPSILLCIFFSSSSMCFYPYNHDDSTLSSPPSFLTGLCGLPSPAPPTMLVSRRLGFSLPVFYRPNERRRFTFFSSPKLPSPISRGSLFPFPLIGVRGSYCRTAGISPLPLFL